MRQIEDSKLRFREDKEMIPRVSLKGKQFEKEKLKKY